MVIVNYQFKAFTLCECHKNYSRKLIHFSWNVLTDIPRGCFELILLNRFLLKIFHSSHLMCKYSFWSRRKRSFNLFILLESKAQIKQSFVGPNHYSGFCSSIHLLKSKRLFNVFFFICLPESWSITIFIIVISIIHSKWEYKH